MNQCESCGAQQQEIQHETNCIREYTGDGTCSCPRLEGNELKVLDFHGRKMLLCSVCFAREQNTLKQTEMNLHTFGKNVPDKIEHKLSEFIKTQLTVAKWQEVYTTERPHWIVENFSSIEEMRDKLIEFITSMEKLEWETKTRKRAAFDAAKELDARMSKEQRDALINDPNFKPVTNSEFNKIVKERELDEVVKTIGIKPTAQQRKAIQSLINFGLSAEEIKAQLKL